MKCHDIDKLAADYLGNEMGTELVGEFERHLEECATCRKLISELRATLKKLSQLPTVIEFPGRVADGSKTRMNRASWRTSLLKAAAVLAFGICLGRLSAPQASVGPPAQPHTTASSERGGQLPIHPKWIELADKLPHIGASLSANLLMTAKSHGL